MPRKKAATTIAEPPKLPACATCHSELDWRDQMYGGKAREATDDAPASGPTCKRCHQVAQRRALRGGALTVATKVVEGQRGRKRLVPVVARPTVRRQRVHFGSYAAERIAAYGRSVALKQARRRAAVSH